MIDLVLKKLFDMNLKHKIISTTIQSWFPPQYFKFITPHAKKWQNLTFSKKFVYNPIYNTIVKALTKDKRLKLN